MIWFRHIGLLLALLFVGARTTAQTVSQPTNTWGTWFIGTVLMPGSTSSRWGGYAEVQARSNGLFQQYFYNELKAGVTYDLDKNITAMVAGGRYQTNDYQDLPAGPLNVEKRLWEQLVLNQYLSRIRFEHRYRLEQRWFDFRGGTQEFRNRLRYRLNLFVPLNAHTIGTGTVFASVYDEIFLNPRGPAFERNRLYAGLGYQFSQRWVGQLGWVNQTNYNPASFAQGQFTPVASTGKNNLVMSVIYRIIRRSNTSEQLPSQPD
ncbi:hypothetical protein GCM10027578_42200 [Spirosoma luteolum]